ncbi:Hsp20/alpha crystallin family protein [Pseudanabaena sp. FACHB-2040]|uniref:Hsp20/alpha crystallin family protein n=1 Tax=Pseudanabaena sp. FACHB-2040 TaxID=2692859 RepID=UPI001683C4ED|nr:Hsp20/alpha crystallin family protein [Pseudanabaena sp. FACHB-2040]MBD2257750.1 Hsp20/alpha crystallin family protein [Pseudanabaena sp. FACHB-2040]
MLRSPWSPMESLGPNYQHMAALWSALAPLDGFASQAVPSLELRETEDSLLITVTLPGQDLRDVQVQATPHSLMLVGQQQRGYQDRYGYSAGYAQFQHTIPLPVPVQDDQMQVAFQGELLVVTLPKARQQPFWRSPTQKLGTALEDWTLIDEVKHQGHRLGRGWRQFKQWLGRQLHRIGDLLLQD